MVDLRIGIRKWLVNGLVTSRFNDLGDSWIISSPDY